MKYWIIAILLVLPARASELAFEVVDEIRSGDSQERQSDLFLDAYDAFSAVVRDGVFRWQDFYGHHEVAVAQARLVCDVAQKTLKVMLPAHTDSRHLDAITRALGIAFVITHEKRTKEMLRRRIEKIRVFAKAAEIEADPTRREILRDLVRTLVPMADGEPDRSVRLQRRTSKP